MSLQTRRWLSKSETLDSIEIFHMPSLVAATFCFCYFPPNISYLERKSFIQHSGFFSHQFWQFLDELKVHAEFFLHFFQISRKMRLIVALLKRNFLPKLKFLFQCNFSTFLDIFSSNYGISSAIRKAEKIPELAGRLVKRFDDATLTITQW